MTEAMMQGLFLSLLYVLGLAFAGIFRDQLDILTIGFLGFPLGAALWVIFSVTVIILGVPYTPVTMFFLTFLYLLTAGFIIYKKKEITSSDTIILTIFSAVFIAILSIILASKYTYMTLDSWSFLDMANDLTRNAGFYNAPASGYWWIDWGIFVGLIHAGAIFLGFDYVYAYTPLLVFWFYLSFAWLLYKALKPYSLPYFLAEFLSISAILIFISTYFLVFQAFYVHCNMTASVYFTLAVIGLWNFTKEENVVWLILATISMIAFTLSRIEGPLVALCVLTVLISLKETSYKQAVSCVSAFMLIIFSWHFKLLIVFGFSPPDLIFLDTAIMSLPKLILFLVSLIIFLSLTILLKYPAIRKIKDYLPLVMLYILVFVALLFTFYKPIHMGKSFSAILANMFITGDWESSWVFIFILVLGGFFLKPLKKELLFVSIVVSYFLFLYNIVFLRVPYRWGLTCTSNRMFTHFFPTIMFYLFLKYAYNFPWQTTEEKSNYDKITS